MKLRLSPFAQFAAVTAYIWLCVLLLYGLSVAGVTENTVVIATLILLTAGLWSAAYFVGVVSWAIATTLFWLAGAVVVIFTFG